MPNMNYDTTNPYSASYALETTNAWADLIRPQTKRRDPYNLDLSLEKGYLQDLLQGKSDYISELRQSMLSDINEADTRAKEQARANLARSGLLGSGIASQVNADLTGKKERALVGAEAQIGQLEEQAKRFAISQLLGLKGMEMQNYYQGENLDFAQERFDAQKGYWDWQRSFQEKQYRQAQDDKWLDFFSGLLGAATSALMFL